MNCAVLEDAEGCVAADSDSAAQQIISLREAGKPVRLVVRRPGSSDLVRMAAYNASNILHAYVKVTDATWAAPLLSVADRCGIRTAVTLYPIVPGVVQCADVLETVASLCSSYRTMFLFMFPRILLPAKTTQDGYLIGGRSVDNSYISNISGGLYPSYEYIRRFMEKAHKYLDCTPHACGLCGKDCDMCLSWHHPSRLTNKRC